MLNKKKINFYKKILFLVIPIAMQNLINVAVTSTDVIMLSNVSETVLSGASLGSQVQFILTLIFFGLTSGASVLTAQYYGKKNFKAIEQILAICLKFAFIISTVFTFLTFLFSNQIMHLFSSEQLVISEGSKYLKIVCFSYIICGITMVYLNILRSIEKVKISTLVYLTSLVVNIILNYLLIFGKLGLPKLGIQGAAISTLIARLVELLLAMIYAKHNSIIKLHFKYLLIPNKLLKHDFIKFSIPVTLNELLWGLGTSVNVAILGQLGSQVAAASSVVQVIRQLATVITFGISTSTAIIVGKSIGEGNISDGKFYSKQAIILSLFTGFLGSILILLIRPFALDFLTLSFATKEYLSFMLIVMSYFVLCQAFNTTMIVGIFRAGGDSTYGLFVDSTTMWGGSILFGLLAAFIFKWNILIVYIILMSDEIFKIPLCIIRFKSYKWLNDVTQNE